MEIQRNCSDSKSRMFIFSYLLFVLEFSFEMRFLYSVSDVIIRERNAWCVLSVQKPRTCDMRNSSVSCPITSIRLGHCMRATAMPATLWSRVPSPAGLDMIPESNLWLWIHRGPVPHHHPIRIDELSKSTPTFLSILPALNLAPFTTKPALPGTQKKHAMQTLATLAGDGSLRSFHLFYLTGLS